MLAPVCFLSEHVILTDEGGKDLDSGLGNEILHCVQDDRFAGVIVSESLRGMPGSNPRLKLSERAINARRVARLGLAAGLILLVALPRLTHLNGYLIVDEADRWRWAETFYRALISGDLRATLVGDGYPGIVPVWLETIWLLGESVRRSIQAGHWFGQDGIYMLFHVWSRTEHLAQQRLPITLFNSLMALGIGWTSSKIYGRRAGLLALILIALDPFYLSDSRVNRAEAVITGLLTLSILFLVRYGQTKQRRWLIASGVLGGFSFLTKIQGLVVLPVVAAIVLFFEIEKDNQDGVLKDLVSRKWLTIGTAVFLWALAAGLIWVVFWPAMWVRPLDVLRLVFDYTTRKAGSEGVNLFFMGQHFYNADPGPLFYPVVAFLRMTPLTMLGLALAAWGGVRSLRTKSPPDSPDTLGRSAISLLIYILLYAAIMTFGSHKQDRYLMPVFPALDILAAIGWVVAWGELAKRRSALRAGRWAGLAGAGFVLIQAVSVLPYHPYYFPYFNQLLGGGRVGAQALRVGWGEGMDLVADYMNSKPNAANLKVAARWNQYMFDFAGETLPFDESARWTQADYVVLYIQQTQRMLDPSPGIIRYFQARQPEHVVRINGIEYAQIYASPFTRATQPQVSRLAGRAALLGYRWQDADSSPAGIEGVRVIWENQGLSQAVPLAAGLAPGEADPAWSACQTVPGFEEAARTPGEVVESQCDLSQAAGALAAGAFDLRVGLGNGDGSVDAFLFPQGRRALVKAEDGAWRPAGWKESLDLIAGDAVPAGANPVDITYGRQIRLVAYQLSASALQPGQPLTTTLYWQALAPLDEDYMLFNHLFGLDGAAMGAAEAWPGVPTSDWLPGQVLTTTQAIRTDAAVPVPALATLDIGWYDAERRALPTTGADGQPRPVTLTRVKFVPPAWPDQAPPVPDDVLFGDHLLLEGHAPLPQTLHAGEEESFGLQLWWQALAATDTDYTVFVQVLDAAGNIVSQADGVPVAGRYPTSAWEPGERIVDSHPVQMPASLSEGEYALIVGLYDPTDGHRLPLAQRETDFLRIGGLRVIP
jgi:4-amino-4-deoxy-L-arabinose transferase-like glycosyltransferase